MARELTKLHEEVLRLPATRLVAALEVREAPLKGEVVLLVAAQNARTKPREHVDKYAKPEL
jgi:16S rRNA C1402 (ribose-2'-O) methylase RsmI